MKSQKANLAVVLALAASTAALSGCGQGIDSGTGKRDGIIVSLGKHGMICETMEGEMALPNFRAGGGGSSTLHFNVQDPEVYRQLDKAREDRRPVQVDYNKRSLSGPCTMEGDTIFTSVSEFQDAAAPANPKSSIIDPAGLAGGQVSGPVTLSCVPGANDTLSCAPQ